MRKNRPQLRLMVGSEWDGKTLPHSNIALSSTRNPTVRWEDDVQDNPHALMVEDPGRTARYGCHLDGVVDPSAHACDSARK